MCFFVYDIAFPRHLVWSTAFQIGAPSTSSTNGWGGWQRGCTKSSHLPYFDCVGVAKWFCFEPTQKLRQFIMIIYAGCIFKVTLGKTPCSYAQIFTRKTMHGSLIPGHLWTPSGSATTTLWGGNRPLGWELIDGIHHLKGSIWINGII